VGVGERNDLSCVAADQDRKSVNRLVASLSDWLEVSVRGVQMLFVGV